MGNVQVVGKTFDKPLPGFFDKSETTGSCLSGAKSPCSNSKRKSRRRRREALAWARASVVKLSILR